MTFRSILAVCLLSIAPEVFAAKPATTTPASTSTADATSAAAPRQVDSSETRDSLRSILDQLPPAVATVLKLDPTLFTDSSYLANYPALAEFVAAHPEVAHNPGYFLEGARTARIRDAESDSFNAWRSILSDVGGFLIFVIFVSVFVWIIRTLVQQRRWSRISRTQAEVHAKLLERFATSDELLAYIQSPAGRRFLESAPISLQAGAPPMSAPVGRMFWSLQVGLVTTATGIGLDIASLRLPTGPSEALYTVAVLALCVGVAFILSAGVFYVISRKFGLWQPLPNGGGESMS